ncbi:hypothetical protein AB664_20040 [Brucella anthropi]|uniref:EAL domain-containing protein n=1 Tax=Brucella anthropi TaxID=529 RepID=A0A656Z245_BRUAN|nr:hypothetical protein AB664_20040 [Brucella anthropi]
MAGGGLGAAGVQWRRGHASLAQQIKRSIAEGRVDVVFQPLVRLRDGQVIGAEVLARLSDEDGVPIPPDVFIPIAEQQGDIKNITRIVVRKALDQMNMRLHANEDLISASIFRSMMLLIRKRWSFWTRRSSAMGFHRSELYLRSRSARQLTMNA